MSPMLGSIKEGKEKTMKATTSEAKNEKRKDEKFNEMLKLATAREGLTCSEVQVDAILSEGEST